MDSLETSVSYTSHMDTGKQGREVEFGLLQPHNFFGQLKSTVCEDSQEKGSLGRSNAEMTEKKLHSGVLFPKNPEPLT